ncbi:MAG: nucleotidyltransferase family protein [Aquaticitalea sp.]
MTNIHALLIAAGESKRMGAPKQLLPWGTKTLIEHQIEILQKAALNVSIVLGANAELIQKTIEHLDVDMYHNNDWESGMGTSISFGVKGIHFNQIQYDGILIALVDQPLITSKYFQTMIDSFESGKNQIIVSQSDTGFSGPPVLFDSSYLDELMELHGEAGAKPIIKKHQKDVVLIPCQSSLEDIDTPEAYQRLLKMANLQS